MTNNHNESSASQAMTEMQEALYQVEAFLNENYQFRRNLLSGKTEWRSATSDWQPMTNEVFNSIVREAKKNGIGGKSSPKQNIDEYINSDAIPNVDPIRDYLKQLPQWDGKMPRWKRPPPPHP